MNYVLCCLQNNTDSQIYSFSQYNLKHYICLYKKPKKNKIAHDMKNLTFVYKSIIKVTKNIIQKRSSTQRIIINENFPTSVTNKQQRKTNKTP